MEATTAFKNILAVEGASKNSKQPIPNISVNVDKSKEFAHPK